MLPLAVACKYSAGLKTSYIPAKTKFVTAETHKWIDGNTLIFLFAAINLPFRLTLRQKQSLEAYHFDQDKNALQSYLMICEGSRSCVNNGPHLTVKPPSTL